MTTNTNYASSFSSFSSNKENFPVSFPLTSHKQTGALHTWTVSYKQGTIDVSPPQAIAAQILSSAHTDHLIYCFSDNQGKRYYGSVFGSHQGAKHSQTIFSRMQQYNKDLLNAQNNKKRKRIRPIVEALLANPTGFQVSIVDHLPRASEEELLEKEAVWQDHFHTRSSSAGYNKRDPRTEPKRACRKKVCGMAFSPWEQSKLRDMTNLFG